MMNEPAIDRLDDRRDAVEAALTTALPGRVIAKELKHYSQHTNADLQKGVLAMITDAEDRYSSSPGMVGREGVHRFTLVGHVRPSASAGPREVENAELAMIEDVKAFVRTSVPGLVLRMVRARTSRQAVAPYGFIVCEIEAWPPGRKS